MAEKGEPLEPVYGAWFQRFRVKEMCRPGWMPKCPGTFEMPSELLSYFGAANFEALDQIAMRKCAALRQWSPAVNQKRRSNRHLAPFLPVSCFVGPTEGRFLRLRRKPKVS